MPLCPLQSSLPASTHKGPSYTSHLPLHTTCVQHGPTCNECCIVLPCCHAIPSSSYTEKHKCQQAHARFDIRQFPDFMGHCVWVNHAIVHVYTQSPSPSSCNHIQHLLLPWSCTFQLLCAHVDFKPIGLRVVASHISITFNIPRFNAIHVARAAHFLCGVLSLLCEHLPHTTALLHPHNRNIHCRDRSTTGLRTSAYRAHRCRLLAQALQSQYIFYVTTIFVPV